MPSMLDCFAIVFSDSSQVCSNSDIVNTIYLCSYSRFFFRIFELESYRIRKRSLMFVCRHYFSDVMSRCSIVIQEKIEFSYNLGGSAIYESIHLLSTTARERGSEPTIKENRSLYLYTKVSS